MPDKFDIEFKKRLQNYEAPPPPDAWENISSRLDKRRPIIGAWQKWGAVAAIALIFSIGGYYIGTYAEKNNQNTVVKKNGNNSDSYNENNQNSIHSNQNEIDENSGNSSDSYLFENNSNSEFNQYTNENENVDFDNLNSSENNGIQQYRYTNNQNSNKRNNNYSNNSTQYKRYSNDQELAFYDNKNTPYSDVYPNNNEQFINLFGVPKSVSIAKAKKPEISEIPQFAEMNYNSLEELEEIEILEEKLTKKEKAAIEVKKAKENKFFVSSYVAPTMMGSFNEPHILSREFNQLRSENQMTNNYGAKMAYKVNDKLKIRSGIGVIDLVQNTYDVTLGSTSNVGTDGFNISPNHNLTVIADNINPSSLPTSFNGEFATLQKENISQEVTFIEVPFEIEYEVLEKGRFAINLSSGLSTLILNGNQILLNDENRTVIGEASNINDVSFSANAGVKFDFIFNRNFSVNIEPQLKYLFNSFDNNRDVAPYIVGVQAGLSYSFQ